MLCTRSDISAVKQESADESSDFIAKITRRVRHVPTLDETMYTSCMVSTRVANFPEI